MKKIDLIIKCQYLLTMDEHHTYINEPRAIAIHDSKIIDIDTAENIDQKYQAHETLNRPHQLAMPGMINTHTHIPMSLMRGFADDLPLKKWLEEYIWPLEATIVDADSVKLGAQLGIIELIRSGITTFNDMYFFQDSTCQVAKDAGVRGVVSFGSTPYFSSDKLFNKAEDFIEKWKGDTYIQPAIGPHGPHSVPKKNLIQWHDIAQKHNVHFHIHVAETLDECQKVQQEHKTTPVQYLHELGMLHDMTLAAHCIHINETDVDIMASTKCHISHVPESNMKLGSGHFLLDTLAKKNAHISLGTDGPSSNNNMNMFLTMKHTALLHKFAHHDPTLAPAEQVVTMATKNGAKALHLDHIVGSIEVGKEADIILIDTYKPHIIPYNDPYSSLVYSMHGEDVSSVVIRGKIVMKDHVIQTIDEAAVLAQATKFFKKMPTKHEVEQMKAISS